MANIRFTPLRAGTTNVAGERISSIDPLLSRTNYFDGQLLKAADLNRDQLYLDERLLELGQVFGPGIVDGLEPSLKSGHVLEISPGIAIAPSGRVLQLSGPPLIVDLLDHGLITTLNDGRFRRHARGLYALVLSHAETIDGVAEAYPGDLAAAPTPQVSAWAEGVELCLVPLPLSLPNQDEITVRANLARELLGNNERLALPSDDAVALGLLAVDRGRILWLDRGLLRRPQRALNAPAAFQQDLAVHYQELLQAVLAARRSAGLAGAFAASQYFQLLPPWGPLPSESIDPVNGWQQFFPADFDVSIAPVRDSELAAVLADSAQLGPIDLERDADCDIMVLVPMSDAAFALRARQLEAPAKTIPGARGLLARLDHLALRVLPQAPVHRLDTDAAVWETIWAEADPDKIHYVRRPPRTAETAVSAVVLALGTTLPLPPAALPLDAAKLEEKLDAALEAADVAKEARNALEVETARLRTRVGELEKAVALGGDERLADALAEIEQLTLELDAAQAEIDRLSSDQRNAGVLANALEAISVQIDQLKTELDAARAEIERLKTAASPIDDTLKQRLEQLSTQLDKERAQATALEKENSRLEAELRAAQEQLTELEAELEELQRRLRTATDTDAELQKAHGQIDQLKAEITDIRKLHATAEAELAESRNRLEASLEREATSNRNFAELRTTLEQTRNETKALEVERTTLQEQITQRDLEISNMKLDRVLTPNLKEALTLQKIASARGASQAAIKAADTADALIGNNAEARIAATQILLLADRNQDAALWPSIAAIAQADPIHLVKIRDQLLAPGRPVDLPRFFVSTGRNYGLSPAQINLWEQLVG